MTAPSGLVLQYGEWDGAVAELPDGAEQTSPLHPGARSLEELPDGCADALIMAAPPGTVERRYGLAQALRVLRTGGRLTALAPKAKGGSRLRAELEAFGCAVEETSRRHHRICVTRIPEAPVGLPEAVAAGAPRVVEAIGLWSQPGLFSWDRLDPGSALLMRVLPSLSGRGADLGCGVGVLAHRVLGSGKVAGLLLADIDRRAVDCARRNVSDPRASFNWADARTLPATGLDFVITNPPFHDARGGEDRSLGQAVLRAAAGMLRRGGSLFAVANRHLPYEAVLGEAFSKTTTLVEEGGFKVIEARR